METSSYVRAPREGDCLGELIPPEAESKLVIHVPSRAHVPETIELNLLSARTHVLVHLESGAEAHVSIVLDAEQADPCSLALEVVVEAGATLTLLCLQNVQTDRVRIVQKTKLDAGARFQLQNITLGGTNVDHEMQSQTAGPDVRSAIDWMFYAKDSEEQRISAQNIFSARQGSGEMTLVGIAQGRACVSCDAVINIGVHGAGTDTYLTQHVLMLDPSAKVNAVPGLEIKTNDVKASHSATVSRVTSEDLFYFSARGIPEQEAREMFVEGFLCNLTERITDKKMQGRVIAMIGEKYRRASRL